MSQEPDKKQPVRRRESFDLVSQDYDLYHSPYPPEVVDAVVGLSRLHRGSSVLEIGCGTGQLSAPLAQLGVHLVAVELGPHLAARASQHLRPFPHAQVEVGSFEAWPLPSQPFDAVVSASAFHWLDPAVRFAKSAEALRPGGYLTILHVHRVRGGTPGFLADMQPLYLKWGMSDDPSFQPTTPDNAPIIYQRWINCLRFALLSAVATQIPMAYSTTAYLGLLRTDSLVNGLDDESRRGFLQDSEHLVETKYGGEAVRNYVYEIVAAQRAS